MLAISPTLLADLRRGDLTSLRALLSSRTRVPVFVRSEYSNVVHMVIFYNIYIDTEPPRARPGPSRPSLASGGPPAAARCAASQIRPQSTGTRSGDLRPSEAYALPIQGYHLDLSTGACGAVLRSCCSHLDRLWYGTV